MATKKTTARKTTDGKSTKGGKTKVNSATPFLWYQQGADEAARFYVSLFQGARITGTSPMSTSFRIAGTDFIALNGGPSYKLTPAFSIMVEVNTQDEIDRLWGALTANGGREDRCGWLVDKFGLSWQVIPKKLPKLLFHKDPQVAQRAMEAMLKMQKIDIAAVERAARGK